MPQHRDRQKAQRERLRDIKFVTTLDQEAEALQFMAARWHEELETKGILFYAGGGGGLALCAGCSLLGIESLIFFWGCRVLQGAESGLQGAELGLQGAELGLHVLIWGRRVQICGCRVLIWGRRVQNWGCRVQIWGCRVQNWGCRVLNWGCRVQNSSSFIFLLSSGIDPEDPAAATVNPTFVDVADYFITSWGLCPSSEKSTTLWKDWKTNVAEVVRLEASPALQTDWFAGQRVR